jgi:outer membrane lipoprotein-sorting protein
MKGLMYRIILLILFLRVISSAEAQQMGAFTVVKDLSAFKTRFSAESAKVLSISSDFTQEKELLAVKEKITSTGKFWFKRSDRVRIDYQKPFIYKLVMNGDRILLKDEQKENRVNVKSNKLFQQVNRIMVDCIQGTILTSNDFSTAVLENEKFYRLEMTPVNKSLKDFFSTIHLYVEKADYSVSKIEMNEPGGDRTVMSFTNKHLNLQVSDEVFAL